MYKKAIVISLVAATMLVVSCKEKEDTSEKMGYVTGDILADENNLGEMPTYSDSTAGTSTRMERAFENAPPMIPHSTQGLLPIKTNGNMCLSCHMPAVAEAVKSTAIPKSHFMNFRPEKPVENGAVVVAAKELGEHLDNTRFNCTQCHVQQTNVTVSIENQFEQVFRNETDKTTSNYSQTYKEGVQ